MIENLELEKEANDEKKLEYQNEGPFKENQFITENNQSDEEDDYEGYFLEPVSSTVNIAEKIAEANKKLLEEENAENKENRPRKVHFSDELINFEPNHSDDNYAESIQKPIISEENEDLKQNLKEFNPENNALTKGQFEDKYIIMNNKFNLDLLEKNKEVKESVSEVTSTKIQEESDHFTNENNKLILVLVSKDQNSSSVFITRNKVDEDQTLKEHIENADKTIQKKFVRPKSAKKSCEVSKISPNLNYSLERKEWKGCKACNVITKSKDKEGVKGEKVGNRNNLVSKISLSLEGLKRGDEIKRCCDKKTENSRSVKKDAGHEFRLKSGTTRRNCFVLKTELPNYNGFRSEYGLSAEQLEERKRKTLELNRQKQQNKLKERQEERKRRNENEEIFQKWLFNKSKRQNNTDKKSIKSIDTLTRSDSYILSHASYATNHNVPYSVDYSFVNKNYSIKKNRTIFINKLMNKVTPNFKRSFNIYFGVKP